MENDVSYHSKVKLPWHKPELRTLALTADQRKALFGDCPKIDREPASAK